MCVRCQFSACEYEFDHYFSITHREIPGLMFKRKNYMLHLSIYYLLFRTSLQLCAKLGSSQSRVLGVCQLGALQCMGRSFTLASDSDCHWPDETSTSCEDCKPGTVCQGESVGPFVKDDSYLLQLWFYFCNIYCCFNQCYCALLY